MRIFHFGDIRTIEKGTVGDYALHIQCAWRLESSQSIVTGRSDLWRPAEADPGIDWENWDFDKSANFQDKQIGLLLGSYDPEKRSFVNNGEQLLVETVQGDEYGGAIIGLSGGYRLVIFPSGALGEDWRIFRPATNEPYFVVEGGRIESE